MEGGWWELDESSLKVKTSSYKINKTKDIMYNVINIITLLYVIYKSC